ncbi:MAG: hypothetical protein RIC16_00570 [Rhodospirillales bacterium]
MLQTASRLFFASLLASALHLLATVKATATECVNSEGGWAFAARATVAVEQTSPLVATFVDQDKGWRVAFDCQIDRTPEDQELIDAVTMASYKRLCRRDDTEVLGKICFVRSVEAVSSAADPASGTGAERPECLGKVPLYANVQWHEGSPPRAALHLNEEVWSFELACPSGYELTGRTNVENLVRGVALERDPRLCESTILKTYSSLGDCTVRNLSKRVMNANELAELHARKDCTITRYSSSGDPVDDTELVISGDGRAIDVNWKPESLAAKSGSDRSCRLHLSCLIPPHATAGIQVTVLQTNLAGKQVDDVAFTTRGSKVTLTDANGNEMATPCIIVTISD